jgi:hypothetical protein
VHLVLRSAHSQQDYGDRYLDVRVARNVDGMDTILYDQVLSIRKKFFAGANVKNYKISNITDKSLSIKSKDGNANVSSSNVNANDNANMRNNPSSNTLTASKSVDSMHVES